MVNVGPLGPVRACCGSTPGADHRDHCREAGSSRQSVSREALEAFIVFADAARSQRDSEFCVGLAEHEASQHEFDALITALDVRDDP